MGKATEPPKCKACGKQHWGTCADHDNRGYLSNRAAPATPEVKRQRIAKATEVLASMPAKGQKPKKSSGGSSAVERRPSKSRVAGSTPARRSKPTQEGPLPSSLGDEGMTAEDQRVGAPEAQDGQTTRPTGRKSAPAIGPTTEGGGVTDAGKPVAQAATPKRRGRPATGFDKKAYDREQAAKRRAAKKQPNH